jgi:TonB family protein
MAFQRRSFLVPLVIWLVLRPAAHADDNGQKRDEEKHGESQSDERAASKLREELDEPIYDLGPGVTPPRVTHKVRPERRQSGRFRVSGRVVVSLVVSSAGLPAEVKIVQGMDVAIDQTVVAAVKQWRFKPGRKDGKVVAVRITEEVSFIDL